MPGTPRLPDRRRLTRLLLDTLLPAVCPGCQVELRGVRWICGACRRRLRPAPPGPVCLTCRGRNRSGEGREAGYRCADPDHAPRAGFAAFWMEPPLDGVIHALKYAGREELARPLGRLMALRIPGLPPEALVTPVPLHRTRHRDRGYNQARALAVAAGRVWGTPPVEVLSRSRATRAQARLLETDRPANVAGAFRVSRPELARGRTWILVDDVSTSGSTLLAASAALEGAGARRVIPVALALA